MLRAVYGMSLRRPDVSDVGAPYLESVNGDVVFPVADFYRGPNHVYRYGLDVYFRKDTSRVWQGMMGCYSPSDLGHNRWYLSKDGESGRTFQFATLNRWISDTTFDDFASVTTEGKHGYVTWDADVENGTATVRAGDYSFSWYDLNIDEATGNTLKGGILGSFDCAYEGDPNPVCNSFAPSGSRIYHFYMEVDGVLVHDMRPMPGGYLHDSVTGEDVYPENGAQAVYGVHMPPAGKRMGNHVLFVMDAPWSPDERDGDNSDASWIDGGRTVVWQFGEIQARRADGSVVYPFTGCTAEYTVTGVSGETSVHVPRGQNPAKAFDGRFDTKLCTFPYPDYANYYEGCKSDEYCLMTRLSSGDGIYFDDVRDFAFFTGDDCHVGRTAKRTRIYASDDGVSWSLIGDSGIVDFTTMADEPEALTYSVGVSDPVPSELPFSLPGQWYGAGVVKVNDGSGGSSKSVYRYDMDWDVYEPVNSGEECGTYDGDPSSDVTIALSEEFGGGTIHMCFYADGGYWDVYFDGDGYAYEWGYGVFYLYDYITGQELYFGFGDD